MLESYTILADLSAHTSRTKLMTIVMGTLYRSPGVLVKMLTTLDVLSGDRTWLGIGAGGREIHHADTGREARKRRFSHDCRTSHPRDSRCCWPGSTDPWTARSSGL